MTEEFKQKLIEIVEVKQTKIDPSHCFQHVMRVTNLAEKIGRQEGADLDILIPAALFHDIIVYPKNSPQSRNETEESAQLAIEILKEEKDYPQDKIDKVATCIRQCSFSKQIEPELLESKILQDADRLEATGAISIMRTYSSGGQMNRPLYHAADPFCKNGPVKFRSSIDLFYQRLLVVEGTMHTELAKEIAKRRTIFLKEFLDELELELKESEII